MVRPDPEAMTLRRVVLVEGGSGSEAETRVPKPRLGLLFPLAKIQFLTLDVCVVVQAELSLPNSRDGLCRTGFAVTSDGVWALGKRCENVTQQS